MFITVGARTAEDICEWVFVGEADFVEDYEAGACEGYGPRGHVEDYLGKEKGMWDVVRMNGVPRSGPAGLPGAT